MALDYDLISGNSNYNFVLAGLGDATDGERLKKTVAGVMMNEIPMAFANDFSTAREALDDLIRSLPLGQTIGGAVSAIRSGVDTARQIASVSGRSKLTVAETRKVWNGSGIPQFDVDFFFYATSTDMKDKPMDKVKRLLKAVLPSGSQSSGGKIFQKAPLGYKVDGSGTLMLKIGRWFTAPNLVMVSFNYTPSREVMSDGSPLYVTGSFSLVPYQAISYEEFLGYYQI